MDLTRSIVASAVAILAATLATPSRSQVITGPASVIDGDTLHIGAHRIRLHGVDAPEAAQTCNGPRGTTWACGVDAARLLHSLTQGQMVTCVPQPKLDPHGRAIATCTTSIHDLNATLVCRGMAWAFEKYSRDYSPHEAIARSHKRGIWQADTPPPWEFRQNAWDKALTEAPHKKPIVGVWRDGQCIYHTPWSRHYRALNLADARRKTFYADEGAALSDGCRATRLAVGKTRRSTEMSAPPSNISVQPSKAPCS